MKKAEITLEYQNYIDRPPVASLDDLHSQACTADNVTMNSWGDTWLAQIKANKEHFGSFAEMGIGHLFGQFRSRPVICAGSGPSLRNNVDQLGKRDRSIGLVSCLHNFHLMEDKNANVDFYVSLDAGPVTIEEVSEGGSRSEDEYWELTRDRTLLAYIGSHPDLLKKWQGKIHFFNAPVPDPAFMQKVNEIEKFNQFLGSGGNVLGAAFYFSKAFLGGNPIVFVGADFSFGYDNKFHGWDSKYDAKMGQCIPLTDVYGIKVKTWPSYANFKSWFDWVALTKPGLYFNCTEGGCLGSYPQGNINAIRQMDLATFFAMYNQCEHMRDQAENPQTDDCLLLF